MWKWCQNILMGAFHPAEQVHSHDCVDEDSIPTEAQVPVLTNGTSKFTCGCKTSSCP